MCLETGTNNLLSKKESKNPLAYMLCLLVGCRFVCYPTNHTKSSVNFTHVLVKQNTFYMESQRSRGLLPL